MRPSFLPAANRPAAAALATLFAALPAHALLRFNEGRDQIYVTAYVAAGYDSNIYASADSESDLVLSSGAGLEYARRAGLIGVNGTLRWDLDSFVDNSGEDSLNPSASLEFSKGTGRTTGSLQFNTSRDSRADPTVGLRTESWTHGVNLDIRYPVIERYTLAGNIGWSRIDYQDASAFSDLDTYTVGADLFYSWRSDRDLLAGYRYRTGDAAFQSETVDHSVYAGVSGRIVSKLSGSARVGVSHRTVSYPAGIPEDENDGLYASVSGTWPVTKKASFTLTLTEDFSTTSTNFQTRSSSVDLTGKFSHTTKFSTQANIGGGYVEYLSGFAPGASGPTRGFNGQDRSDTYFNVGCGAQYTLNNHFTLGANYGYYRNWSDLSAYEFSRHTFSITLSTRW